MTSTATNRPTALDLALTFSEDIATLVDISGARVTQVTISENHVHLKCDTPADADRLGDVLDRHPDADLLDHHAAPYSHSRHYVFDEVVQIVAAAPLPAECACGVRCDHQAVTA